jgi:putative acetyltransferase
VNERAFGTPQEANLVDALRRGGAITLSLVATRGTTIVGHALFTPVEIVSAESRRRAVALGPMAVLPEHQREGIGTRLVDAGLAALREAGHGVLVVLGHPEYYPRFGFEPARDHGIECPYDAPPEAFMVLELEPGALRDLDGTVRYRPEFDEV